MFKWCSPHPIIPSPHMSHPNTPNLTCILIVQRDFVQGLYRGEIHQRGLPEAQLHLLWVLLAVQELHQAIGRGEEQGTVHLVKPKPRKPLGARWRSTRKKMEKHGKNMENVRESWENPSLNDKIAFDMGELTSGEFHGKILTPHDSKWLCGNAWRMSSKYRNKWGFFFQPQVRLSKGALRVSRSLALLHQTKVGGTYAALSEKSLMMLDGWF